MNIRLLSKFRTYLDAKHTIKRTKRGYIVTVWCNNFTDDLRAVPTKAEAEAIKRTAMHIDMESWCYMLADKPRVKICRKLKKYLKFR